MGYSREHRHRHSRPGHDRSGAARSTPPVRGSTRQADPPRTFPKPALLAGMPLAISTVALAQERLPDETAELKRAAGEIWSLLFLFALLALAVHLILRTRGLRHLREVAKGLAFLASAYLAAFFFLASVSGIARFLHLFGFERDTSGLLAVPLGLVVAYKLYGAYERWRVHD